VEPAVVAVLAAVVAAAAVVAVSPPESLSSRPHAAAVTSNTVTVGGDSEGGLHAEFTYSPNSPLASEAISFNASTSSSSSDPIVKYTWDFGAGKAVVNTTNAIYNLPANYYPGTGSFVVTLTVTDSKGRTQKTTQTVSVG